MEREAIAQLAEQIAGKIKTEADLNDFSRMLKKNTRYPRTETVATATAAKA